jgi:hypothetical protein
MTLYNTSTTIKHLINKYSKELTLLTFVAIILSVSPISTAKAEGYTSRVVFTKNIYSPVATAEPKTEVITGISKNNMDQLNNNPNPEVIKQFMCTIAPEYGVDWKLVYAIGYHESGNYHSSLAQRNNNYFGRKAKSGGYASWSTPEQAIRNQFEYIKNNYYSRGLTTPAAINPIYAEDSSWCYAVSSVISTL